VTTLDQAVVPGLAQHDVREALSRFAEETRQAPTVERLGDAVFRMATRLVPVERIAFFLVDAGRKRLHLVAHRGYGLLERRSVPFGIDQLRTSLRRPVALEGCVEASTPVEPGDPAVFRRWGIALAFPVCDPGEEPLGFLVLGAKRDATMFSPGEVALLELVAAQSALAAARIRLHRALLVRSAETERLAELNRVASDFVSSVSHELKTPLTSIRMMAEMLRDRPAMARDRIRQYAGVIEGESDRLTRLIENILDFSKIERGVMRYTMVPTDLNDVARRAMGILAYPLAMQSFTATVTLDEGPLPLSADPDALCGALLNLLSNAMKYSAERKRLGLRTFREGAMAAVSVRDEGIGIDPSEREAVFAPFVRGARPEVRMIGGVGLGLTLVRHCADAHAGLVRVADADGGGTQVTLLVPLAVLSGTGAA
jgi:signal transduction histidine kinase